MSYLDSIRENSSGHRRKLLFFIERLEAYRKERNLDASEVRVLDVGCGNGLKMTLPIGEQGYSLVGIDFHEPSIAYANQMNHLENVEFSVKDVSELSNADCLYDAIFFADILEHLLDPQQLLIHSRSLLKPDGLILICIPNGFGPYEIEDYLFTKGPLKVIFYALQVLLKCSRYVLGRDTADGSPIKQIPYNRESGHLQFFTLHTLRRLVHSSGYRIRIFRKGSFITGPFTHAFFKRSPILLKLNLSLTNYLPAFMCSTWYFECKSIVSDQ